MKPPLHDQPARDRFICELDRNFCVSAGAGVGKTTAIVERIATLAREKPEALPRLVVVTFAKAAAEELRTRAREKLLKCEAPGKLLPLFRQAFFGTIHSFCLKLVNQYGHALGVSPAAQLLEQGDEEDAWERYCESPALDAVELDAAMLGEVSRFVSFDELLNLAREIGAGEAERIVAAYRPEPKPAVDFSSALADDGGRSKENTRRNQESLRRFLADMAEEMPFLRLPDLKGGSGSFLAAYQAELFPFASWLARGAALLAARISLGFDRYRREQEIMTYDDQIAWCRRLLNERRILEELRGNDWIVLLDEAQDTDAAMFSILAEVARPPGSAAGEWPKRKDAEPPRAGRFCFVGDEQQSIYGRADLATYREYIEAYETDRGGERLEFSVTMRCPQRVIGAVNAIFFDKERLRQTHFAFRELHAPPGCREGAAWVLPIEPLPEEKPAVKEAFRAECRQVAAFLSQYGAAGLGVEKWSDVAVLCPRREWLREAADIFIEAGLPGRLVSQQRLQLELPERSWPAALFHVLLNPWDRFELLGVLREVFAVSDVDLADAQADNRTFTFQSGAGLSEPLAAALEMLRELRGIAPPAGSLSLGEWVDRVLDATRLAARLEAIGQRANALQRLRHEALRAECAGEPLREWVRRLVRGLRKPAQRPAQAEDEIPLMTCQAAKGLEWPVVLPLGLAREIGERKPVFPRLEQTASGGIEVHLSSVTVDKEEAKAQSRLRRAEELQRLFYVTLTRAKSLLILPDTLRLYKKSEINFMKLCQWENLDGASLFEAPPPPKR